MSDAPTASQKVKRDRSPSFPFISLKVAVNRLAAFEVYFKRYPAPAKKAGLAWGMKADSSQAAQTLAALKAFGFVEYTGSGNDLQASISESGRTLLRAQQESVKQEILKRAALQPKIIAKYWHVWNADRPQDPICLDDLVLKGAFTEPAAKLFLSVYDDTISFAGLSDSDKESSVIAAIGNEIEDEEDDEPHKRKLTAEVGDLVQVEIGGTLQIQKPVRVRAIQHDQGRAWVFVEGSDTGIPMEQIVVEAKGSASSPFGGASTPQMPEVPLGAFINKGEREWLRGPLSKEVSYRLIVAGDLGPKEIGKLIKLLKAQQAVLSDDEDEEE